MADEKKRVSGAVVWREARELMWRHRRYLAFGFGLMIISRLAGFVLPASPKVLVDYIYRDGRVELLLPLAGAVAIAAVIQAVTSFSLSQVISVTAQRAITEMRRKVQSHVVRLPIRFFDSTQTGVLISRIMTDAEGIRNLVGTGIVQLAGGLITATVSLTVLFWLNSTLTFAILGILFAFGSAMTIAAV